MLLNVSVSKATFAGKYSYLDGGDTDADNGHNYFSSNAMVPIFCNIFLSPELDLPCCLFSFPVNINTGKVLNGGKADSCCCCC